MLPEINRSVVAVLTNNFIGSSEEPGKSWISFITINSKYLNPIGYYRINIVSEAERSYTFYTFFYCILFHQSDILIRMYITSFTQSNYVDFLFLISALNLLNTLNKIWITVTIFINDFLVSVHVLFLSDKHIWWVVLPWIQWNNLWCGVKSTHIFHLIIVMGV